MKAMTKKFDCVEMKNRIQAERMREFEKVKDEYGSYADYIKARSEKSELVQQMMRKLNKYNDNDSKL